MNKKTLLQLLIFSIILLILTIFFFTYFYEQSEKNKQMESRNKLDDQSLPNNESTTNIIENIKYLSFDNLGNQYEINAQTGEIKSNDTEIIYMKNVSAKIDFTNSETIHITADSAIYNSKNYNTNFSKNIKISYLGDKIECKKLDLLFNENLALLYDNIIYTSSKTKLFADRLEIDLITKNSKISMNDKNTKIKMLYNK